MALRYPAPGRFAHKFLEQPQLVHAHVVVEGLLGLVAGSLHDEPGRHALVELERNEGLAPNLSGELETREARQLLHHGQKLVGPVALGHE
jgi:hypothetical protein